MAGKVGRSGRPKAEEATVAVSTRIPQSEADAFEEYVRKKGIAATGSPGAFSMATILRGLIREAIERAAAGTNEPGAPDRPIASDADAAQALKEERARGRKRPKG